MTATDELRRLLDERGVEHEDKHTELAPGISDWDSTWWRGIAGLEFHAVGDETYGREGCVYMNGTYLTPEQAIVATLGSHERTCHMEQIPECRYDDIACSECGVALWAFSMDKEGEGVLATPKYCPNCGAKVVSE